MSSARWAWVCAWGLSACAVIPAGSEITSPTELSPPIIESASVSCDRTAGKWSVTVGTSAWASGGTLYWTTDGRYIEVHDALRSVGAASDGHADKLKMDLPIALDFRSAGDAATAYYCDARPQIAIAVRDLGGAVTDCIRSGTHTSLLDAVPALADCTRRRDGVLQADDSGVLADSAE